MGHWRDAARTRHDALRAPGHARERCGPSHQAVRPIAAAPARAPAPCSLPIKIPEAPNGTCGRVLSATVQVGKVYNGESETVRLKYLTALHLLHRLWRVRGHATVKIHRLYLAMCPILIWCAGSRYWKSWKLSEFRSMQSCLTCGAGSAADAHEAKRMLVGKSHARGQCLGGKRRCCQIDGDARDTLPSHGGAHRCETPSPHCIGDKATPTDSDSGEISAAQQVGGGTIRFRLCKDHALSTAWQDVAQDKERWYVLEEAIFVPWLLRGQVVQQPPCGVG